LEKQFIEGALKLQNAPAKERAEFSKQCLAESRAAEAEWLKRVEAVPAKDNPLHAMAWNGFNKQASL
jgi:hypothetical protein